MRGAYLDRMRSFEELESLWAAGPAPSRERGTVRLLVRRTGGGAHDELTAAELTPEAGLVGDRWAEGRRDEPPDPDDQLTLMNARAAELIAADVHPLHMPGDNVLVDLDLSEDVLPVGSRVRLGSAVVEVSAKPHLGCKKFAERFGPGALRWVNLQPNRSRRLRGVNCRIVQAGRVALGDAVEVLPGAGQAR